MDFAPILSAFAMLLFLGGVFALIVYLRQLGVQRLNNLFQQVGRETGLQYIEAEKSFWKETFPQLSGYLYERKTFISVLSRGSGKSRRYYWYVKMQCNTGNYTFKIWKEGFSGKIGKFFGGQDIEIGIEDFDKKFIIRGNRDYFVRNVLNNNIRHVLNSNRNHLKGRIQIEASELYYEEMRQGFVMQDASKIKNMLNILKQVAERADAAYHEVG